MHELTDTCDLYSSGHKHTKGELLTGNDFVSTLSPAGSNFFLFFKGGGGAGQGGVLRYTHRVLYRVKVKACILTNWTLTTQSPSESETHKHGMLTRQGRCSAHE